jgi:hypothetical protein
MDVSKATKQNKKNEKANAQGSESPGCCSISAPLPDRMPQRLRYQCSYTVISSITIKGSKEGEKPNSAKLKHPKTKTHKVQNLQAAVRLQTLTQTTCP